LLEGVPGRLQSTLNGESLISEVMGLEFHKRIQFTHRLMPGDILGTEILEEDHETGKKFSIQPRSDLANLGFGR